MVIFKILFPSKKKYSKTEEEYYTTAEFQSEQPAETTVKRYYYLDINGNVQGPVILDFLKSLARKGDITDASLVVAEGSEDWVQYSSVIK